MSLRKGAVMERLTDKNDVGSYYYPKCFERCDGLGASSKCDNCEIMTSVCRKLGNYEDLEEQGRLVKLPCKEAYTQSGDIVYLIYDDEVVECTHCGLNINPVDGKAYITLATDEDIFPYRRPVPEYDLDPTDWCTNITDAEVDEIGKTVFLTQSEAEAKLKELRGGENE